MGLRDIYANIATATVTLTGANTLTYVEVQTGMGLMADRKSALAMAIDEIDYYPSTATFQEMTAANDAAYFGLTVSSGVADLTDMADRRILHAAEVQRLDLGAAASGVFSVRPIVFQFFPALIVGERSIFLGMVTSGLASASVLKVRIYYRTVVINEAEFIELAEVFRLVG